MESFRPLPQPSSNTLCGYSVWLKTSRTICCSIAEGNKVEAAQQSHTSHSGLSALPRPLQLEIEV